MAQHEASHVGRETQIANRTRQDKPFSAVYCGLLAIISLVQRDQRTQSTMCRVKGMYRETVNDLQPANVEFFFCQPVVNMSGGYDAYDTSP